MHKRSILARRFGWPRPALGSRWAVAALVAGAPGVARATPSEAATLGGVDLYANGLDTFQYFETDQNLFVNPALAQRYRRTAQVNLGSAPGIAQLAAGTDPRGVLLVGLGDRVTAGLALNRSPAALGEDAALGRTLDQLTTGNSGELRGGTFRDPLTRAGVAEASPSAPLQAPLDLIVAVHGPRVSVGADLYAAFGRRSDTTVAEEDPGGFDGDWTSSTTQARSSYVGGTVGVLLPRYRGGTEVWARVTRADAWSDERSFGPARRGEWRPALDATVDRTVGLADTWRWGLGAREVVALSDDADLTLAAMVDHASGRVFAVDRLADDPADPDESAVAQAEDDTLAASTLTVRAGGGLAWRPQEALELLVTVSGQGDLDRSRFDDHAGRLRVPGSTHQASATTLTLLRLPVVSFAGAYDVSESLTVRSAIRSSPGLHTLRTATRTASGDAADGFRLAPSGATVSTTDLGDLPPLTVALGPGVHLGAVTLDAALGGLFLGYDAGSLDLFSRIDAVFAW
jgi:hypothetical protein